MAPTSFFLEFTCITSMKTSVRLSKASNNIWNKRRVKSCDLEWDIHLGQQTKNLSWYWGTKKLCMNTPGWVKKEDGKQLSYKDTVLDAGSHGGILLDMQTDVLEGYVKYHYWGSKIW